MNFSIDILGDRAFAGYFQRERWNGWAQPLFNFDQAQAVLNAWEAEGLVGRYESAADAFFFFNDADDEEPEVFFAREHEGQKVYPIGSGSWIWEEAESSSNAP